MKPCPEMFVIGSPKWPGVAKVSEESGELVQVVGKLTATGGETDYYDGSDLRLRLIEEAGDVLAACQYLIMANPDLAEGIEQRRQKKLALFLKWHTEALQPQPGSSAESSHDRPTDYPRQG